MEVYFCCFSKADLMEYQNALSSLPDTPPEAEWTAKGAEAYRQGDYSTAVRYYKRAAARGDSVALSNLGYCYYYGRSVAQDKEKARQFWEQAAAYGDVAAIYKLGDMHQNSDIERNPDAAPYKRKLRFFDTLKRIFSIRLLAMLFLQKKCIPRGMHSIFEGVAFIILMTLGGCLLQSGTFKKLFSIFAMSSGVLRESSAVRTRPGVRLHDAGGALCRSGQGGVPVAVKQFGFYSHIVVVLADDLFRAYPAQVCHQRGGDALQITAGFLVIGGVPEQGRGHFPCGAAGAAPVDEIGEQLFGFAAPELHGLPVQKKDLKRPPALNVQDNAGDRVAKVGKLTGKGAAGEGDRQIPAGVYLERLQGVTVAVGKENQIALGAGRLELRSGRSAGPDIQKQNVAGVELQKSKGSRGVFKHRQTGLRKFLPQKVCKLLGGLCIAADDDGLDSGPVCECGHMHRKMPLWFCGKDAPDGHTTIFYKKTAEIPPVRS